MVQCTPKTISMVCVCVCFFYHSSSLHISSLSLSICPNDEPVKTVDELRTDAKETQHITLIAQQIKSNNSTHTYIHTQREPRMDFYVGVETKYARC